MPDRDVREHVRHIFTLVGGNLQVLVDILPLDDGDCIGGPEEIRICMMQDIVGEVFQPVHLDAPLLYLAGGSLWSGSS